MTIYLVKNVSKTFTKEGNSKYTKELIIERGHILVKNVSCWWSAQTQKNSFRGEAISLNAMSEDIF